MKRVNRLSKMIVFSILTSNIAYAQVNTTTSDVNQSSIQKVLSNFSFNYFAKYTGPSLSPDYQEGATYNRFDGGRNLKGQRQDTTGSKQTYQSFKLSYKLPKNMSISYGLTYQDNTQENIKFKWPDGAEGTREYGRSFNDHRISLFVPSIISGTKANLSSTFFYQLPTTQGSKDSELNYTLGIQPTLSIYSNIRGLFHGLTASVEKGFYDKGYSYDEEVVQSYTFQAENLDGSTSTYNGSYTYMQPYRHQGVKANIGAYVNYMLTDKTTLKSSVEFDWDQVGDQVGTTNEWGNNMDNIGNLGASYRILSNITIEGGVNFSLEEPAIDKTAIFTSLDITI